MKVMNYAKKDLPAKKTPALSRAWIPEEDGNKSGPQSS
jgi:hypothetical protein